MAALNGMELYYVLVGRWLALLDAGMAVAALCGMLVWQWLQNI